MRLLRLLSGPGETAHERTPSPALCGAGKRPGTHRRTGGCPRSRDHGGRCGHRAAQRARAAAASSSGRVRYADGRLEYHLDDLPILEWPFPDPMGPRAVIGGFTMADVVTIPSHLPIPTVRTCMTVEAARDLADPATPPPAPADEHGRSAQTFLVDVVVRSGGQQRRAVARGRDIYAATAQLAVEAVGRILTGRTTTAGVSSAGAIFDAPGFLRALSPHVTVEPCP
ncbi:hypothetical protein GCM10010116_22290 [Microbispora rosea subsp. aerata]|nr:hypothetical protein [Microbispora rosea]GGO11073.1 hypothetical protein GCM10010116_22290 [Microbispora rosea subsp. aerata]GIH53588.1 hypothetical protein Mro02_05020 [Microbispora rosea subsp. aerata]GLJ86281.1 hypothetical protein GCM10017588_50160 [Microbispora rosea subsp. aerata]